MPWSSFRTGSTKGKVKVHPGTGHESLVGEWRYSSTLSLTSAVDVGGWPTPRPGRFTPGKGPIPICMGFGGPQGRSGWVRKISPPNGIRSSDRPARSKSMYWMNYPGPQFKQVDITFMSTSTLIQLLILDGCQCLSWGVKIRHTCYVCVSW
jgi:hypothetical protein